MYIYMYMHIYIGMCIFIYTYICVPGTHTAIHIATQTATRLFFFNNDNKTQQNRVYPHSIVCCRVLQCVVVCCSALPCVAVCCTVLQCVAVCCTHTSLIRAVCCSVLQCIPVYSSMVQCVAVCCSVLQCVARIFFNRSSVLKCVPGDGGCCNVLLCVAVCCSVLYTHTSLMTAIRRADPSLPSLLREDSASASCCSELQ